MMKLVPHIYIYLTLDYVPTMDLVMRKPNCVHYHPHHLPYIFRYTAEIRMPRIRYQLSVVVNHQLILRMRIRFGHRNLLNSALEMMLETIRYIGANIHIATCT